MVPHHKELNTTSQEESRQSVLVSGLWAWQLELIRQHAGTQSLSVKHTKDPCGSQGFMALFVSDCHALDVDRSCLCPPRLTPHTEARSRNGDDTRASTFGLITIDRLFAITADAVNSASISMGFKVIAPTALINGHWHGPRQIDSSADTGKISVRAPTTTTDPSTTGAASHSRSAKP